jgi:hypothetical protein
MSLPREFNTVDKLSINSEHLVRRTTVGGAFEIMIWVLRQWVRYLSKATFCWMLTILFLVNNIHILAVVFGVFGAYFFGHYRVWYSRWKARQGFAALVPVL